MIFKSGIQQQLHDMITLLNTPITEFQVMAGFAIAIVLFLLVCKFTNIMEEK